MAINRFAPPDVDEFLTAAELAILLHLKEQSLAAMRVRGGGPPFTRVGRAVRYSRSAVAAWLAARTATSTAQLATDPTEA